MAGGVGKSRRGPRTVSCGLVVYVLFRLRPEEDAAGQTIPGYPSGKGLDPGSAAGASPSRDAGTTGAP